MRNHGDNNNDSWSASNSERKELVRYLAACLRDHEQLQLSAIAHDEFPKKPWLIKGFTPDVIAVDQNTETLVLGDVLTPDDLCDSRAIDRLVAHTSLAMAGGRSKGERIPLHVAIVSGDEEVVEELLRKLAVEDHVTIWSEDLCLS